MCRPVLSRHVLRLIATGTALLALVIPLSACGPPAAKPAPAEPEPPPAKTVEPPAPTARPEAKAAPEEPTDPCSDNPAAEAPVVEGVVGEGKRLVRVINEGEIELRVRLLNKQLEPVYPGTLRIPPGARGEYKVGEGVYHLRYRLQSNCEVRRGSAIRLSGRNRGYEKVVRTRLKKGGSGLSRRVDEPL